MDSSHRLTLLRHAKAGWDDPTQADRDRSLAPRGRSDARAVSRRFDGEAFAVSVVLCSPAVRTRETWEGVRAAVAGHPVVSFVEGIYQARADTLLGLLRGLDDRVDDVLLIGHNPAVSELAFDLAGDGDEHGLRRLAEKFPPGAFATLAITTGWSELGHGTAHLDTFALPSDPA